ENLAEKFEKSSAKTDHSYRPLSREQNGSLTPFGISPFGKLTAGSADSRSASASLTPARRLNFKSASPDQFPPQIVASIGIPHCVRDFACGLPLRSRPQPGSVQICPSRPISTPNCRFYRDPSPALRDRDFACGLPLGLRLAHARKSAQ